MRSNTEPMLKSIFSGVLISLFGASVGFGLSQVTIGQDFKSYSAESTVKIQSLYKADDDIKSTISSMRQANAQSMRDVIELHKEVLTQNQEFINLLKVQNEMLRQKYP